MTKEELKNFEEGIKDGLQTIHNRIEEAKKKILKAIKENPEDDNNNKYYFFNRAGNPYEFGFDLTTACGLNFDYENFSYILDRI